MLHTYIIFFMIHQYTYKGRHITLKHDFIFHLSLDLFQSGDYKVHEDRNVKQKIIEITKYAFLMFQREGLQELTPGSLPAQPMLEAVGTPCSQGNPFQWSWLTKSSTCRLDRHAYQSVTTSLWVEVLSGPSFCLPLFPTPCKLVTSSK